MNVEAWLLANTQRLTAAGIASARLDCLILLEDLTGHDRAWLLAHPEFELPGTQISELETKIAAREQHMPLAYIRGHVAFYGREFTVNEHVLVPRPESEAMINLLKQWATTGLEQIVDVGTGSGALAISAKLELPAVQVFGLDIDPACLEVARQNGHALQADVEFSLSDLLENHEYDRPYAILANLPYVPIDYPVNQAARHEPKLALYAGVDGLDDYRRFWQQISQLHNQPLLVITEALEEQHHGLATLARHYGYFQTAKEGLAQAFTPLTS